VAPARIPAAGGNLPGSAGWLVLRTLRLPQGLEPLLASEQPGDRCRRAERTASGYGQPDTGCRGVIWYLQQDDRSVSAEWVTWKALVKESGLPQPAALALTTTTLDTVLFGHRSG
jgi:hypothetical protein